MVVRVVILHRHISWILSATLGARLLAESPEIDVSTSDPAQLLSHHRCLIIGVTPCDGEDE